MLLTHPNDARARVRARACSLNRSLTWATRMAWKYSYKPPWARMGHPRQRRQLGRPNRHLRHATALPSRLVMGWGEGDQGRGPWGRAVARQGHTQGFVCGKPETFVYHSRLGDPVKMAEAKKLAAAKAEREEQLIQRLGDIALNSENEMAAIAACNGALDRIDGKPVTRTAEPEPDYHAGGDGPRSCQARGEAHCMICAPQRRALISAIVPDGQADRSICCASHVAPGNGVTAVYRLPSISYCIFRKNVFRYR